MTNENNRLVVDRVKPLLTEIINSSSSNIEILIWNLDSNTLNFLATPSTLKNCKPKEGPRGVFQGTSFIVS